MRRNWFIKLDGATKSGNRDLEAKARALPLLKGYATNPPRRHLSGADEATVRTSL